MYTFSKIVSDTTDPKRVQRTVVIEITDGTTPFQQNFIFGIDVTREDAKAVVKKHIDALNTTPAAIDGDFTIPQATLDRQDWEKKRNQLRVIMELVRDGVFTGTETQITTLQQQVKAGFKAGYLT